MGKLRKLMLSKHTIAALAILMVFSFISTFAYADDQDKVFYFKKGHGKGGYLGVSIVRIPLEEKKELGVKFGVKVQKVTKASAAEKAGIKLGDVIQFFNGTKIRVPQDLIDAVRKLEPESKATVKLVRAKKQKALKVILGDYAKKYKMKHFKAKRAFLGVHLDDMDADFGSYFGVKNGEGALVKKIVPDTPAEEAELKSGDVIVKIGPDAVKSARDVTKALKKYKKGDRVDIHFLRHKKKKSVKVELDEKSTLSDFYFKFDKLHGLKGLKGMHSLQGLKHLKGLDKLKGLHILEDLDIDLEGLADGHHHFDGCDVYIKRGGDNKRIKIIKKIEKNKKKELKKKLKEEKKEQL